jgi:hypothetical protein
MLRAAKKRYGKRHEGGRRDRLPVTALLFGTEGGMATACSNYIGARASKQVAPPADLRFYE